ncbi:hypothetical protein VNI00_001017 [Paramarasmius palmivorus]|uniref:JmjC domain-containing protein n=1 Tax=Paramarasmius palmivorus TaxID=297713 RepID=A0AAW0E6H1_9AGAR
MSSLLQVYERFRDDPLEILPQDGESEEEWLDRINPDGEPLHPASLRYFRTHPSQRPEPMTEDAWRRGFHSNYRNLISKQKRSPDRVKEQNRINQANSRARRKDGNIPKLSSKDKPKRSKTTRTVKALKCKATEVIGNTASTSPSIITTSLSEARQILRLDLYAFRHKLVPHTAESICWIGDKGSEVYMCLPQIEDEEGKNVVKPVGDYIRHLSQTPFVEQSGKRVLRLESSQLPANEEDLLPIIREALGRNQMVHLVGFRKHAVQPFDLSNTPVLNAAFLGARHISPLRPASIHSLKETTAYQLGLGKGQGRVRDERVQDFMDRMRLWQRIECILAISMTGMTFGHPVDQLNDVIAACRNLVYEEVNDHAKHAISHATWGLLHHACYFSFNHHDAGGELAATAVEHGFKIWTGYFPSDDTPRSTQMSQVKHLCSEPLESDFGDSGIETVTILLQPGDVHLQPPGLVHSVYTPLPCFMLGSSWWMYDSLHLTETSRRIDGRNGDLVTNQDFDEEIIFTQLVALLFGMRVVRTLNPTYCFYQIPILALCAMILDPQTYVSSSSKLTKVKGIRPAEMIPLQSSYLDASRAALALTKYIEPSVTTAVEFPQVADPPEWTKGIKEIRRYLDSIRSVRFGCQDVGEAIRARLDQRRVCDRGRVLDPETLDKVLEAMEVV